MSNPLRKMGWLQPTNSQRQHAFQPDGRALCGKWALMFKVVPDSDVTESQPNECRACRKRLDKLALKHPRNVEPIDPLPNRA